MIIYRTFWSSALAKHLFFHLKQGSPSKAPVAILRGTKTHSQRRILTTAFLDILKPQLLSDGSNVHKYSWDHTLQVTGAVSAKWIAVVALLRCYPYHIHITGRGRAGKFCFAFPVVKLSDVLDTWPKLPKQSAQSWGCTGKLHPYIIIQYL